MANRAATVPQWRDKKRAIALAGGGPAAGFHLGALRALEKKGITFDVWSLSCIGAWVGIYFNQLKDAEQGQPAESRADRTYTFFRDHAFRDTASYEGFPVNKAFAPNLQAFAEAWRAHLTNPLSYWHALNIVNELPDAAQRQLRFLSDPRMWSRGADWNVLVLNNILALHPATRFLTSLIYQSEINGLSNIYDADSSFLDSIDIDSLDPWRIPGLGRMSKQQLDSEAKKPARKPQTTKLPEIYHNAWQLHNGQPGKIQLFNNRWLDYRQRSGTAQRDYLPISHASLCACSALPYIEQTVKIPNADNAEFSEGALVDTVNFRDLVEDHPDLDEIWIVRIVDYRQIRRPHNLHDSLGNLCQQFAAEVGENDIALFKSHLSKAAGRTPRLVELQMKTTQIGARWDHANLDTGRREGEAAVAALLKADNTLGRHQTDLPKW